MGTPRQPTRDDLVIRSRLVRPPDQRTKDWPLSRPKRSFGRSMVRLPDRRAEEQPHDPRKSVSGPWLVRLPDHAGETATTYWR